MKCFSCGVVLPAHMCGILHNISYVNHISYVIIIPHMRVCVHVCMRMRMIANVCQVYLSPGRVYASPCVLYECCACKYAVVYLVIRLWLSQRHVYRCTRAHACVTYAAHTSQAMLPYRRVRRSQLLLEQRSYWQFAQPYQ